MAEDGKCLFCNQNFIVNNKLINCRYCQQKAHLHCAEIEDGAHTTINKSENLFWFCDKCMPVVLEKLSCSLIASSPQSGCTPSEEQEKQRASVSLPKIEETVKNVLANQYQQIASANINLRNEMLHQYQTLKTDIQNLRESNVDLVRMLSSHQQANIATKPSRQQNDPVEQIERTKYKNNSNMFSDDIVTPTIVGAVIEPVASGDVSDKREADTRNSVANSTNSIRSNEKFTLVQNRKRRNNTRNKMDRIEENGNHVSNYENSTKQNSNNRPAVIGKATSGLRGFEGAKRLAWLFVGRAGPHTTVETLQEHLINSFPNEYFNVTEVQKHEKNTSPNRSYKIGFDFSILDQVLDPEVWPENVIVKKYQFFRNRGEEQTHWNREIYTTSHVKNK